MGVGISVVSMVGIAVVGKTIAVSVVSQTIAISAIVGISISLSSRSSLGISGPLAVVSVVGIGKSIAVAMVGQAITVGAIVGIGISLSLRGGVHSGKKAESGNGSGLHVYLFVCKLEE